MCLFHFNFFKASPFSTDKKKKKKKKKKKEKEKEKNKKNKKKQTPAPPGNVRPNSFVPRAPRGRTRGEAA